LCGFAEKCPESAANLKKQFYSVSSYKSLYKFFICSVKIMVVWIFKEIFLFRKSAAKNQTGGVKDEIFCEI